MGVTIEHIKRIGPTSVEVYYSSDLGGTPTFYIYVNGTLYMTTQSDKVYLPVPSDDSDGIVIEIFDSSSDSATPWWPRRFDLQWQKVDDIDYYKIEEYVDSSWTERAKVKDLNEEYKHWRSRVLDDVTTHQFRITPYGDNGETGSSLTLSGLMVRHPDSISSAPDLAYSADRVILGDYETTPPDGWSVSDEPTESDMNWFFGSAITSPFFNDIDGTESDQYGMLFRDAKIDETKDVTISFELTISQVEATNTSEYFIPFALYPSSNPANWLTAQGFRLRMRGLSSTKYGMSVQYYDKTASAYKTLNYVTGAFSSVDAAYWDIDKDKPVIMTFESDATSSAWRVIYTRWYDGVANVITSDWVDWADTGSGSDDHYINMGKMLTASRYCEWSTDGITYTETTP